MGTSCGTVLAFLTATVTVSVRAHHSIPGVYDPGRVPTLCGEIVEVRYVNPQIRIVIDQIGADGNRLCNARGDPIRWTGEAMSVRVAPRRNFTRQSLQVGQAITLRGQASRKEGVRRSDRRERDHSRVRPSLPSRTEHRRGPEGPSRALTRLGARISSRAMTVWPPFSNNCAAVRRPSATVT